MRKAFKRSLFIAWAIFASIALIANITFIILFILALPLETAQLEQLGDNYVYNPTICSIDIPYKIRKSGKGRDFESVLNYNFDERYIIVKQTLAGDAPGRIRVKHSDFAAYARRGYAHGVDCYYYWIIDKDSSEFFGPYILDEFQRICDSLEVDLAFDPTEEPRPFYR